MGMPGVPSNVTLNALTSSVVRSLPSGDCLDRSVVSWRPGVENVTSELSEQALAILNRERNLYGACLQAATTRDQQILKEAARSGKARVRRAAALNPRLTPQDSGHLWLTAGARRDPALAIALLRRNPHLYRLLVGNPEVLALLSARDSLPGPVLLAERLAHMPAARIREISEAMFPGGHTTLTRRRNSEQEVLASAVSLLLQMVVEDELFPPSFSFAAVCQYLALPALGTRLRHNERYEIRGRFAQALAALPGHLVVHVMNVVGLSTETTPHVPSEQFRLRMASLFTLDAALHCSDYRHHASIAADFEYWCPPGQEETGRYLAGQIGSFEQLDTFRVLSAEWTGTLNDLLAAARAL